MYNEGIKGNEMKSKKELFISINGSARKLPVDGLNNNELLETRNKAWVMHYQDSTMANQFGQRLKCEKDIYFLGVAKEIEAHLECRNIDWKDNKPLRTLDITDFYFLTQGE